MYVYVISRENVVIFTYFYKNVDLVAYFSNFILNSSFVTVVRLNSVYGVRQLKNFVSRSCNILKKIIN